MQFAHLVTFLLLVMKQIIREWVGKLLQHTCEKSFARLFIYLLLILIVYIDCFPLLSVLIVKYHDDKQQCWLQSTLQKENYICSGISTLGLLLPSRTCIQPMLSLVDSLPVGSLLLSGTGSQIYNRTVFRIHFKGGRKHMTGGRKHRGEEETQGGGNT